MWTNGLCEDINIVKILLQKYLMVVSVVVGVLAMISMYLYCCGFFIFAPMEIIIASPVLTAMIVQIPIVYLYLQKESSNDRDRG